ncbi:MAG: lipopolysaccharide biosynthesis protein [Ekhidna sp.]
MGIIIKQSFWGTFITYLGLFFGYINVLYFRAEYFDLQQIGIFSLVTANAMMISPISSFGMSSSYLKFFPSFDVEDRRKFFSFLFLITLIGNALVIITIWLLSDHIESRYAETAPTYINYLSISIIIILANSFFELFFRYSNTIMQVTFPTFLREIYLRAGSLILVFGFALQWWDFDGAIIGLGLLYAFAVVFLFIQLLIIHRFRFDFRFGKISNFWNWKLLKFAIYSMLLAGSFAVLNNATYDQVTAILGAEANAIFATCFFIAIVVELPQRNMAKVINPILSNEFAKKNMVEVEKIYKRSSITMSVVGLLLFIGIVTNLKDLFQFIPKGDAFETGFLIVAGICFIKLIVMVSSFAGEIINYSNLYHYNLLFQILAALTLLVLNYFIISSMGLNGAAISYCSAILLHILLKIAFVRFHFKMHPFMKSHIGLFIIGTLIFIGAYFFQPEVHPVLRIVFRSVLTTLIFTILIYRFRISNDINQLIHSTFERLLKINLPK